MRDADPHEETPAQPATVILTIGHQERNMSIFTARLDSDRQRYVVERLSSPHGKPAAEEVADFATYAEALDFAQARTQADEQSHHLPQRPDDARAVVRR
jgi:hypothetical protein